MCLLKQRNNMVGKYKGKEKDVQKIPTGKTTSGGFQRPTAPKTPTPSVAPLDYNKV